MTVSIDPSEVRADGTSIQPSRSVGRSQPPLRGVLIGGLGCVGLIAFTVGAFSFFSGLADPRAHAPRVVMPVAAAMPDLKDGLPALAPETGTPPAAQAATLDLPRPVPAVPPPGPTERAAIEPPPPQLRSTAGSEVSDAAGAVQESRSGARPDRVGQGAKAAPPIQNAAVVADAPRIAALVPPAKAETVKAKAGQPSTFVALPAESKPQREVEPAARQEARKPVVKASAQKAAAHKPPFATPVAEAAPAQTASAHAASAQAAPRVSEDEDAIPGSRQIRAGLKAIGGMFGGSEGD